MKSLRTRIAALEESARFVSCTRQLDILIAAISGDPAGVAELKVLRSSGALAGRLGEVFDALTPTVETDPMPATD